MKKRIVTISIALLLMSTMTVGALAHGHGRGSRAVKSAAYYAVCPYEDCDYTVNHRHNGITYRCHYANDGHDYCGLGYGAGYASGYTYGGCCGR